MFSKNVTLIVRHTNDFENINRVFLESTEVGLFKHWKRPSAFIEDFKKLYLSAKGADRFQIENVVIS